MSHSPLTGPEIGASPLVWVGGHAKHETRHARAWIARGCDVFVTGVVMLMVVWAPLAGGAERPAATALVEQMVFTLVVIWVLKSTLLQPPAAPASAQLMRLAIPMAAFAAYIALQLVPLSPAIMKVVSASTHHLYVRTRMAPPWLNANPAPPLETLSIAPALTRSALLKVLAYFCLMLVVAHYPLEPRNSGREAQSFTGALGVAALISALMAGLAGAVFLFGGHRGLAEVPTLTTLRASGTFHNADHFADYLMLAFPLAVTGALSPESFVRRGWREPFTLFATLTSVVCLVGLMISLSRGAWLAGVLGSAALVFAGSRRQPRNIDGPEPRRGRIIPYAALAGCLLLLLALIVAGAPATGAIADRLSETAGYDTSMLDRFTVWRDSLAVVRDFPALGVGLGCWPEIFSRYDRAPWDPDYFWREAHNDYLQLLEEAGAIGALLAGWILFAQGRALLLARQAVSSRRLALVAAAIAGAVGVAAHELFDFSLQVPANALLLVVILGLAHRQAAHAGVQWWQPARTSSGRIYAAMGSAAVAIVALLLITCTWRHDRLAYPDNLDSGMDAAAALGPAAATARITAMIRAYPAHGPLHLELGRVLQARGLDGPAQHELDTAVWLQPTNPEARDALAEVLFQQGDRREYLQEIIRSVESSPRPSTHAYLARSAIAALSAAELNAVERGYRLALWNPDAVYGLGYLYHCLTRFKERASLYQGAAQRETDPDTRLDYLLKAGSAYFAAADPSAALAALHQAMLLQPNDQRSYRALAMYYGSHGDLPRALASVRDGIAAGADSVGLNIALAEAGWKAGDRRLAVKALDRAVAARPTGFADNLEIGVMYLDCENPARAIPPLKNAVATNPRDADGYYYLASAEQNSYDFAAAAIAFKTALSIAPQRTDIRQAYAMFERMLNKSRTVDSDAALDPGRGRAGTTVPLEQ